MNAFTHGQIQIHDVSAVHLVLSYIQVCYEHRYMWQHYCQCYIELTSH